MNDNNMDYGKIFTSSFVIGLIILSVIVGLLFFIFLSLEFPDRIINDVHINETSKQTVVENTRGIEEDYKGLVTRVIDGDTVELSTGLKIRLAVVDTPERNQPGFIEAKEFTVKYCLGKQAIVDFDDNQQMSYDRQVGLLYCFNDGHYVDINKSLIDSGLAKVFSKYCKISEFAGELCNNDY